MGRRPADKRINVDELKARFDLREFAITQGLHPHIKSRNMYITYSPFRPKERTPSFAVYGDHWWDYGMAEGGDIISLVQRIHDMKFNEALTYLTGDTVESVRREKPIDYRKDAREKRTKFPVERLVRYESRLDVVMPYLRKRGINETIAKLWHLGGQTLSSSYTFREGLRLRFQWNRVMIPYLLGGQVYGMNFRRDDLSITEELKRCDITLEDIRFDLAERQGVTLAEISDEEARMAAFGTRYWKPAGTRDFIWGFDQLVKQTATGPYYIEVPFCLIMEGEFDAMTIASHVGIPAISVKALNSINLDQALRFVKLKFCLADNDPDKIDMKTGRTVNAGFNYVTNLAKQFEGLVGGASVPQEFKDSNEFFLATGEHRMRRHFDKWGLGGKSYEQNPYYRGEYWRLQNKGL